MSEFINFLHETFNTFGTLKTRKMFGGHGIYHQGLMIGLVADDELYLKVDKQTEAEFSAKDMQPFTFHKGEKLVKMSYFQAPEEIYDDHEQANYWANLAYAAAVRANKK